MMNDMAHRMLAEGATAPPDDFFAAPVRRVRDLAARVAAKPAWDILLIVRRDRGLDASEFDAPLPPGIRSVAFVRTQAELDALDRRFDLCVAGVRVVDEELLIRQVRDRGMAPLVVAWTWDNHHSRKRNVQIATMADVVIAAHGYCAGYMKNPHAVLCGQVPLATYQWSRATAAALFDRHRDRPRDDALHGGFANWRIAPDRSALLRDLMASLPRHALKLMGGEDRDRYFAATAEARWLDWASHKVGLVLPLQHDLSTRFFDSLITGQVPIVPDWCRDFDAMIDPATAAMLPVVRFAQPDVRSVAAAWREALARYDSDGVAGAARRHRFALEGHHLHHRLAAIGERVRALAAPRARVEIESGMGAVGPVLQPS